MTKGFEGEEQLNFSLVCIPYAGNILVTALVNDSKDQQHLLKQLSGTVPAWKLPTLHVTLIGHSYWTNRGCHPRGQPEMLSNALQYHCTVKHKQLLWFQSKTTLIKLYSLRYRGHQLQLHHHNLLNEDTTK